MKMATRSQKFVYLTVKNKHFSLFHISQPFSFFPRHEMTRFAVVVGRQHSTTNFYYFFSSDLKSVHSNLSLWQLIHYLQTKQIEIIKK